MSEFVLVKRELLERAALPKQDARGWANWNTAQAYEAAKELRAVLAQKAGPVVERQEPVAIVTEETHNYMGYLVFSGEGSRLERPRPVVEKKAVLLDREIPTGTKLYTSQPAPVAVQRNAQRYEWLRDYMASTREDLDDLIVSACANDKPEELDAVIDACLDKVKELNQ